MPGTGMRSGIGGIPRVTFLVLLFLRHVILNWDGVSHLEFVRHTYFHACGPIMTAARVTVPAVSPLTRMVIPTSSGL